jgi:hypothetical protein
VQNHDLLPTVLQLLGLPPCELLDGESVWPLVTRRKTHLRNRIISGWGNWAALRDSRWNCVLNPTVADGDPRLYDCVTDPDERINVVDRYPEVVRDCRRQLEGLLGSPFPVRYKHQPDAGDYMTLSSYFKRRKNLGLSVPFASRSVQPPATREAA